MSRPRAIPLRVARSEILFKSIRQSNQCEACIGPTQGPLTLTLSPAYGGEGRREEWGVRGLYVGRIWGSSNVKSVKLCGNFVCRRSHGPVFAIGGMKCDACIQTSRSFFRLMYREELTDRSSRQGFSCIRSGHH